MKTWSRTILGAGALALCVSGCAERPGKKKDDDKAAKDKDGKKGAAAKGDAKNKKK